MTARPSRRRPRRTRVTTMHRRGGQKHDLGRRKRAASAQHPFPRTDGR